MEIYVFKVLNALLSLVGMSNINWIKKKHVELYLWGQPNHIYNRDFALMYESTN